MKRNRLWVTSKGAKAKRLEPTPPKEGHDPDLCRYCQNKGRCLYMCVPMKWIDGNVARKETLLNDPIDEHDLKDYNHTLHKLIRGKQVDNGEAIRLIPDLTIRAIAAMLNADMTITEISDILQVSRQAIYKTLRVYTEKAPIHNKVNKV